MDMSFWPFATKAGSGLLFVLAVGVLFLLFLKKLQSSQAFGSPLIKVMARCDLPGKKSIVMVRVMDKVLVLGVTDNQVQNLMEINRFDVPSWDSAFSKDDPHDPDESPFMKKLKKSFARYES